MVNDIADTRNVSYMRDLSRQYDLPITALCLPKGANRAIFEKVLKMAEELNVPTLVIRSPEWSNLSYWQWLRSELPKLQSLTRVKLCLENSPMGNSVFVPSYAFGNINDFRRFKYMTLDTSHLFTRNLDLMRVYSMLKNNIAHIHFADVRKNKEHIMPGEGVLPLESFLTRLHKDNYKGQICVKLDFRELGYDEEIIEEKLKTVRDFYETYFLGIK